MFRGEVDWAAFKVSPTGELLWSRAYGSSQLDPLQSSLVLPDGTALLYGRSQGGNDHDMQSAAPASDWIFRIDGNGEVIWKKNNKDMPGIGTRKIILDVIQLDANFVMLGGIVIIPGSSFNQEKYWFAKMNIHSGNVLYEKTYGGSNSDHITQMLKLKNGNLLMGGYSTLLPQEI